MARIKPQTLLLQSKKKKGPTRVSVTKIIISNLIVVLIVMSLLSIYRHWSQSSRDQGGTVASTLTVTDGITVDIKNHDLPGFAIINTPKGYITVELYKEGFPEIVERFLDL